MSIMLALALAAPSTMPPATPPTVDDIFRREQYQDVEISPDGTKLAIAYRLKGGTHMVVVDRTTLQPVTQVDNGKRGEIGGMAWLGNQQLLVTANHSVGRFGAPIVYPDLYLLDLHRKHPRILPDSFIGVIDGDDRHFLVDDGDVRLMDVADVTGQGTLLAKAPHVKGHDSFAFNFDADHAGNVRFATGYDDSGNQRLYVRGKDKQWHLLNDSDKSGHGDYVLGFSRDNRQAYLDVEQRVGTDVIELYDFGNGSFMPLTRDPDSDPLRVIYSLDMKQPIGAWYGPGKPHARYFYPSSADAKWHRALNRAFPGRIAYVTSASADGRELVIRTAGDRDPGAFYLLDRATHRMRMLFRVRPWIDPKQMAPMRPFSMKARDGLVLHGFISMPTDGVKPAPMVVIVHGGPYLIRDAWGFDKETEWLATHGYAVLHVNFRGSGGDGLDFEMRGFRQWGKAMQDDVTDATRWAIDQGLADASRICIYGASYGGYAALMGVVREPHLYRCAIGLAGVYDLNHLYTWGDIHRDNYGMHYLKRVLGTNKAALAARSPADQAGRIKVPVFLAHGTMDARVPVKYAREMRHALEKAGDPVEYVTYTYEGHGLASPRHWRDFYTRMLKFLDSNLHAGRLPASRH